MAFPPSSCPREARKKVLPLHLKKNSERTLTPRLLIEFGVVCHRRDTAEPQKLVGKEGKCS